LPDFSRIIGRRPKRLQKLNLKDFHEEVELKVELENEDKQDQTHLHSAVKGLASKQLNGTRQIS
jgi:hypothetical protein